MSDNTNNEIMQELCATTTCLGNAFQHAVKAAELIINNLSLAIQMLIELMAKKETLRPRVYHLATNAKKARTRKKNLRRIEREGKKWQHLKAQ